MTPTGTQPGPHSGVSAPGSDAPGESSLDSQIDALLSDAAAPADTVAASAPIPAAPPASSAAADAEAAVASIEKQVESLVEQFVEQPAPAEPTPTDANRGEVSAPVAPAPESVAPVVPESIGALDDQLARLTDELMLSSAAEAPAPTPKPPEAAPAPQNPAPIAEPTPGPASVAAFAPDSVVADVPPPTPKPMPVVIAKPAGPSKIVRVFAKPLAGKPRLIRDTVGWLGFNSMFLAGVVWSYHLWFQKPEKTIAEHSPVSLVASDDHATGEHAGDAHASAEHPGDPHAAQPANAEHDSDEPITGVNPLHKKKPTYALSDAMAEKLNVAKKAEGGGHGSSGGHGAEKKSSSGHGAPPKSGH